MMFSKTTLIAGLCAAGAATAVAASRPGAAARADVFASWMSEHGKSYFSKEELILRRGIFAANVAKIAHHNSKTTGWTMSVNKFADLTGDEFKAKFASGLHAKAPKAAKKVKSNVNVAALPASVDWVAAGAVTPVQNQAQCGSDWAFSATGALAGAAFISIQQLPSLSEQQLVDCSQTAGNEGCNGGSVGAAFAWIKSNGGIGSEASYPYMGHGGACKQVPSVADVATVTDVEANNEDALAAAVAQQPVSAVIEVDQASFQFYTSGVLTAPCGATVDHSVLTVGYGTLGGQDYWKVKNTWGADWGMQGYVLLAKGGNLNSGAGQCGIAAAPSWPTYAAPGPAPTPRPQPSPGAPDSTTTTTETTTEIIHHHHHHGRGTTTTTTTDGIPPSTSTRTKGMPKSAAPQAPLAKRMAAGRA